MRLSALFEEFRHYLRVEREAAHRTVQTYGWCFGDFMQFSRKRLGGTVLVTDFTSELCRAYHYDLAARGLQTNSIRVRLATLGSFGKWAVRHGRSEQNPLDQLTRPRRKKRLPAVPRWEAVEGLLAGCARPRDRAILALLAYGGLRRSEVVGLDVGDYLPEFGLRRVCGKGGHEASVPLPEIARAIVSEYLTAERGDASAGDPLFVVRFKIRGGGVAPGAHERSPRVQGGQSAGRAGRPSKASPACLPASCGVELLGRTRGNLRAVQEHLRHADIQTTTLYTRLTQQDLQRVISLFDRNGE
jgi:integrase/recombinase XerC